MYAEMTVGPIDVASLTARVGDAEDGAVLVFLGVVRDHNAGRSVTGLEYEAYEEMAAQVLEDIAAEAMAVLGTDRIAVAHRIGSLAVGDASVGIAVSSPHRARAYEASRYMIEEIKKRLPVWKQEYYTDGDRAWVPGHQPEPDDARSGPTRIVLDKHATEGAR